MNSGTFAAAMPGIDPAWYADYSRVCGELACLYATAFDQLTTEMGIETALALAPVLLPKVVATAEQEAGLLAEQRRALENWEQQQQQEQGREAAAAVIITAQNPW